MALSYSLILSVLIGCIIHICNGLTSVQHCPSQIQSTLKMADSIDQLSKVLNQSIHQNLKQTTEGLTELHSSTLSKLWYLLSTIISILPVCF